MNHSIQLLFIALLFSCVLLSCQTSSTTLTGSWDGLLPKPVYVQSGEGSFVLNRKTALAYQNEDAGRAIRYFQNWMQAHWEMDLKNKGPRQSAKEGMIFFEHKSGLTHEAYELSVEPIGIRIKASDGAGWFYGIQTLIQGLPPAKPDSLVGQSVAIELPAVTIKDAPRFGWRGMHLDVCRHFFPVAFVKRYIDILALHKMNTFHWHLTEDQGWRIEIKQYPKLTEIGAWRVDREDQPWNERTPPKPGEKATYGGFYTQEEVKEIVAYAAERFITIVPEIEMPGHSVAALAAYPEISCTGGPFYVMPGGYWPGTNIYCAGNEKTFKLLENVLSEVVDLFPGKYVHIGGDEAFKARWEQCPKCQKRMYDEHLKNEAELQSYFIKRIETFLVSKGKCLIGWDEILEGGLAPEATVMSWRGNEGGIAAAREGHDVVMSPTAYCYFDYVQAKEGEPPGPTYAGALKLEKVYSFEPVPEELDSVQAEHILGAQGNVWTEYIPNGKHAEYMAVPRMSAMAEVDWSPKEARNWDDFKKRLSQHLKRLDVLDVNYRPLDL